jgi:solute carrier family 45 protein 1/2/4
LAGVQFVFSIQFAVGGPLLGDQLKIAVSTQNYIFATAGPISGFVAQPIVGVISDRSTSRFGRRRPFIVLGAIACAIGMGLLGTSSILGNLIHDNEFGQHAGDHKVGIVIAITGLWIMNLGVNIVQGPARTLVADLVSQDEQQAGNAMVSLVMGFAAIIANVVGAQFLLSKQPYLWLFTIGVGFILFSCIPTCIAAKEQRYIRAPGETSIGLLGVFIQIWRGFKTMTWDLRKIMLVFFFSWAGYSPFMVSVTNFWGYNVFHGSASNKDAYREGVKMGMYALAAFAGLQTVYSLVMPSIIKVLRIKPTYFITQLISAGCFLAFFWVDQKWIVFPLTALVAINFATFNSIPYGLVTSCSNKDDAGLYMGVLNSASVVAQTVTTSIAGAIVNHQHQDVKWGIAFGGFLAFVGGLLVWILPSPATVVDREEKERLLGNDYD